MSERITRKVEQLNAARLRAVRTYLEEQAKLDARADELARDRYDAYSTLRERGGWTATDLTNIGITAPRKPKQPRTPAPAASPSRDDQTGDDHDQ